MADNFEDIRKAMGLQGVPEKLPEMLETKVETKPASTEGVVFKPRADGNIVKTAQMPTRMAMKIGIVDNKLTLEFEKECGFMQFDKASAWNFIKTMTQYTRSIP